MRNKSWKILTYKSEHKNLNKHWNNQFKQHCIFQRFYGEHWEYWLEKEMAVHSSTLAWRIPSTAKPGGLQSMGLQRVRHGFATFTFAWEYWKEVTRLVWLIFNISFQPVFFPSVMIDGYFTSHFLYRLLKIPLIPNRSPFMTTFLHQIFLFQKKETIFTGCELTLRPPVSRSLFLSDAEEDGSFLFHKLFSQPWLWICLQDFSLTVTLPLLFPVFLNSCPSPC